MLEVNSVTAGYGAKIVLQDLTFQISEGTVLALIGPNGSGKTTFIRAASGVLPLQAGRILVGAQDVHKMGSQQRARMIAVVPQARSIPPAFNVEEVVALGRTPYLNWLGKLSTRDQQVIDQVLEQTDLARFKNSNVAELSGGEQQRLFLARALAQEAPLLLMDEPTMHLDLQHQVNLMQRIYRLAHPSVEDLSSGVRPRTVVVAIHDLNLISRYADLVGLLVGGRLIELGKPQDVLRPDLLSQAYNLPLNVVRDSRGHIMVAPEDDPTGL
jgi:iron complex transport system ATP-binding protein